MQLTLIKNSDELKYAQYKIARVVFAQTHAVSLRLVEAMTSLIANNAKSSGRKFESVASDEKLFDVLNDSSPDKNLLFVDESNRGFQMCLRAAWRMLHGTLSDSCYGATRFHRADVIPSWATSLGYIADIDGFLFYL